MAINSNSSIMKQVITLQKRVLTKNEFSEAVESWENSVPGIRCSYEPLVGREYWSNSSMPQKDAQADARIRIRRRKGLNPAEHRVLYGGIAYDVISVIDDRERGQTHLMVRARASDQADRSTVNV